MVFLSLQKPNTGDFFQGIGSQIVDVPVLGTRVEDPIFVADTLLFILKAYVSSMKC